jgi:hypothetical protein
MTVEDVRQEGRRLTNHQRPFLALSYFCCSPHELSLSNFVGECKNRSPPLQFPIDCSPVKLARFLLVSFRSSVVSRKYYFHPLI